MKIYKKYIIILTILLAFCISICFIPINATKFIPEIKSQVAEDLGIKIHIERLILRLGPSLKAKAPVMHIMYEDGQKFGQFDNVKIFIPWSALIKNDVVINKIFANKLILKINSNDKEFNKVLEKLKSKEFDEIPNITFKSYNVTYTNIDKNKVYKLNGQDLITSKITGYENIKLNTIGEFLIDDTKYLSYDLSLLPKIKMPPKTSIIDVEAFISQIENLDFHSDIIADLKLYKNINDEIQISGLVNIDNISVLDSVKNIPKSFIYLTFLGDKIGVQSNIYASADKKVNIDGVINNSKKRSLDLKVKTDEINLSDLYKKVKFLSDFSKYKSIDFIDGKLKADFSLKGDINKIKSSGFLKVSDASIKASGIDINNISSEIDFSNNMINITNATGYVNNAPIMIKGKIDKTIDLEVLMSKVELKHMCPKSFGVNSGIVSLVANVTGTLDNIVHKENLQIENFKSTNNNGNLSFSNLKIDTNKDNIAYINNINLKNNKLELIKLPLLKLYIERDSLKIPETNIFMPNSKLSAKAEVTNYNSKNPTFNINMNGVINSRDLKFVKSNYAVYPVKLSINGNNTIQNIAAQILMEKALILDEPSIVNFASKIENNNMKIEDLSISAFSGKLSNDFKVNIKGTKKVIISGNIDNLPEPVFKNLRIFIPQQLNITYFDTIAQLKGYVFINGKVTMPEVVGQISAQNIINQFLQVSISNLTLDFNKSTASLNIPQVKLADSVMSINSTISTNISKGILVKNIGVKSKYANTDTFLMYKDNPSFNIMPITISDGKFFAEKALVTIYNSPLHLSALSADFNLKNNNLTMKNIAAEMFNGKLAGSCDFNLKDETFNSNLQARGVSASPIFDVISTRKDTMSGVMDFDSLLSGNILSKQTLNGSVKFIINNGRMGTLGKLEHLLYAQNVIADNMLRTSLSVVTKAITLKDTGLFKYLRGDIALNNGIAEINLLQSQGPLMSLFIKGTYNPDNDYGKLIVLGRLSDEVISGLGVFSDFSFNKLMIMLTGEENKFNIMPEDIEKLPQLPVRNTKEFRSVINGTVDKPSSVQQFNWISYSQKSYKQKEVPMTNVKIPAFVDSLPY